MRAKDFVAVDILASAVRVTLAPRANVVLDKSYGAAHHQDG